MGRKISSGAESASSGGKKGLGKERKRHRERAPRNAVRSNHHATGCGHIMWVSYHPRKANEDMAHP
jgi:hypothetical protein